MNDISVFLCLKQEKTISDLRKTLLQLYHIFWVFNPIQTFDTSFDFHKLLLITSNWHHPWYKYNVNGQSNLHKFDLFCIHRSSFLDLAFPSFNLSLNIVQGNISSCLISAKILPRNTLTMMCHTKWEPFILSHHLIVAGTNTKCVFFYNLTAHMLQWFYHQPPLWFSEDYHHTSSHCIAWALFNLKQP